MRDALPRRIPIVVALTLVGLLASAGSADAMVSCVNYPSTGFLDVVLSSDDAVRLEAVGGEVQVQDGLGSPIACAGGTATTAGTALIDVTDSGSAPSLVTVVDPRELSAATIDLDLRGGTDVLELLATFGPLDLRFGTVGVNTNPSDFGGPSPDADVSPGGVDSFRAVGSPGSDTILGSRAIPGDYSAVIPLEIRANGGNDRISGGDGPPDAFDGGPGIDVVTYAAADRSVAGEISGQIYENNTVTGLDTLTGIESLIGSPLDDTLSGDPRGNTLKGGRGRDVLHGSAGKDRVVGGRGRDELFGDAGIDALFAADRKRDTRINCGGGANRKELAKVDRKDPAPKSC